MLQVLHSFSKKAVGMMQLASLLVFGQLMGWFLLEDISGHIKEQKMMDLAKAK